MMSLLLRSCILSQRRLLMRDVTLVRRIFMHSINKNSKKFTPFLQTRHFSIEDNKKVEEVLIYEANNKSIYMLKIFCIVLVISLPFAIYYVCFGGDTEIESHKLKYLASIALSTLCIVQTQYILKRFVIKMYYNPEEQKYTATLLRPIFTSKQVTFNENDITISSKQLTTCVVKDQPLLLMMHKFVDLRHIRVMTKTKKFKDYEVENLKIAAINENPDTKKIESKSVVKK